MCSVHPGWTLYLVDSSRILQIITIMILFIIIIIIIARDVLNLYMLRHFMCKCESLASQMCIFTATNKETLDWWFASETAMIGVNNSKLQWLVKVCEEKRQESTDFMGISWICASCCNLANLTNLEDKCKKKRCSWLSKVSQVKLSKYPISKGTSDIETLKYQRYKSNVYIFPCMHSGYRI